MRKTPLRTATDHLTREEKITRAMRLIEAELARRVREADQRTPTPAQKPASPTHPAT